MNTSSTQDPYTIQIGGQTADPYRICLEYELDPVISQAVKKLLRCGRKHKSIESDVTLQSQPNRPIK